MSFRLLAEEAGVRRGVLHTPHGEVQTPAFMPVGTQATVKALSPDELEGMGVEILLGNTYHLALRPGAERIAQLGGLHRFMGWPHAILTDSGGFQVFSLDHLARVTDEGVQFRSHLDGSLQRFTPESAMAVQRELGSDVAMAFDQPVPWPSTPQAAQLATDRTHRWAERCLTVGPAPGQLRFGIAQGGFEEGPREASARALAALPFDGFAVGGLSVGEPRERTYALTAVQTAIFPPNRPRYLMGVGTPLDLLEAFQRGIDLCDCVLPTRIARNGSVLLLNGRINLRNRRFADDGGPLEAGCDCSACARFSRAYLRHLFLSGEILAHRLASIHNVRVLTRLVERIRVTIGTGRLAATVSELRAQWREAPIP